MEFSLHRQLKERYAPDAASTEVSLGSYRIDAVRRNGQLVEIQFASLAAIRPKIQNLLFDGFQVLVVKPLVERRFLVKQDVIDGPVVSTRWSPYRGTSLDMFEELVFFRDTFPHPNLTLEVPLVRVEEVRIPAANRRRRFSRPYRTIDVRLTEIVSTARLKTAQDLWKLVPSMELPAEFGTSDLASSWGCRRWIAQRAAYTLRYAEAIVPLRRTRGGWVYALSKRAKAKVKKSA
jgi:hypothetical protein